MLFTYTTGMNSNLFIFSQLIVKLFHFVRSLEESWSKHLHGWCWCMWLDLSKENWFCLWAGRQQNKYQIQYLGLWWTGEAWRGGERDRRGGVCDARELSKASDRQFCFGEMITLVLCNFGCLPKKMKTCDYHIKNRFGRSQTATVSLYHYLYHGRENTSNQNTGKQLYIRWCQIQPTHHAPHVCCFDCVDHCIL